MNLVDRAKNLLMQPKQEWLVISAERHTVQSLYTGYVMILAAIPAVAGFVGASIVGYGGLGGGVRVPIAAGVAHLVVSYVLSLVAVYLMALIIDGLAPSFGGERSFVQALKVAAFSPTAIWLAGVFAILPALWILALLGLYSFFLLFVGLPILMKVPEDKAIAYTVVVIIAAILFYVVAGALASLTIPAPVRGF
jgi:hypothetical protein